MKSLELAGFIALCGGLAGCLGTIGGSDGESGNPGADGSHGASTGSASSPQGMGPQGSGSQGTGSQGTGSIPARTLLLNPWEYDRSVAALLGDTTSPGEQFEPASRQNGYLENSSQYVDSTLAGQLVAAAETLATNAVTSRWSSLVPCDPATTGEEACAKQFIAAFSTAAFRRPSTSAEQAALYTVYQSGRAITDFKSGIQATIQAVLLSEPFLYRTEIGDGTAAADGSITLSPYETASALSYLILGAPPDAELLQAAAGNLLATKAEVGAQAKRLFQDPRATDKLSSFVTDWLAISDFQRTVGKDANAYPLFTPTVKTMMWAETEAYIADWLSAGGATAKALLTTHHTFVDKELGALYGITASTPGTLEEVTLPDSRMGILMQSSFLATYAHTTMSAPVKRGVFMRRRILCEALAQPPVGLKVTLPAPDPTETTRQIFDAHGSVPACSGCHALIGPVGDAFESFDGIGAYRTTDNGKPVDTAVVVTATQSANGAYPDAVALVKALASSAEVEDCFRRQVLRFATSQSDDSLEQQWLTATAGLSSESLFDLLSAYVTSDSFLRRAAQ